MSIIINIYQTTYSILVLCLSDILKPDGQSYLILCYQAMIQTTLDDGYDSPTMLTIYLSFYVFNDLDR